LPLPGPLCLSFPFVISEEGRGPIFGQAQLALGLGNHGLSAET